MGFRKQHRGLLALTIYLVVGLNLAGCQVKTPIIPAPAATSALTSTPALTATPAPPPDAFWVDPAQDLGEISKFVLGANNGPMFFLGSANIEPAKNSGIAFLRSNGGLAGDRTDIQPFWIDLLMNEARLIGAEPSFQVPLLAGSPEKAAAIVRYANIEKHYGIKYWTIGNEPNDYPKDPALQSRDLNAVTSAQLWHDFAVAMKAADPTIKLYGPDIGQYKKGDPDFDPRDKQGRNYLQEFLKVNGDIVDIVTVHRYPFMVCQGCKNPVPTTPAGLLANTPEWDNIIPDVRSVVKEVTGKELPVGVTEFNSVSSNLHGSDLSPDGFYNAIWLSDVLGRMIRHRPEMLAYWLLKSGGDEGHGLMDSYNLRPTYYVFQLYKQFGNHLVAANSPDDSVSVFAAKRDDGSVTAILVNRAETAVKKPLKLGNGDALKLSEAYLLDRDHQASAITPSAFTNGDPVELPGYSASLLIFKP